MSRLVLKILASLAGLGILMYLMSRNIKVWELEVIDPQSTAPAPQKPKAVKKKTPAKASGDDLKKIKGIGPAIEQKLNAIGLKTYQQIADLTTQDIEKIEEQLNGFAGRIERDHWIEQARELTKKPA